MPKPYELFRSAIENSETQAPGRRAVESLDSYLDRAPYHRGEIISIDEAARRRSVRWQGRSGPTASELAGFLDSAMFHSHAPDARPYPAAGGLYCAHIYVAARHVDQLDPGVYYVRSDDRALERVRDAHAAECFVRSEIFDRDTDAIPCLIVITLDTQVARRKYHDRIERFAMLEAGALMQMMYLSGVRHRLGVCALGAVCDRSALDLCGLKRSIDCTFATALVISAERSGTSGEVSP